MLQMFSGLRRILKGRIFCKGLMLFCGGLSAFLVSCTAPVGDPRYAVRDGVIISVVDQEMALVKNGQKVKTYPVSTSKFGLGDKRGSYRTPMGYLTVVKKVGEAQPEGMVFKRQRPTGEVLMPDAPGRDPIVSRIICLRGHESQNRNALSRGIFIHGTPEERNIGSPASYGCIRMRSSDVVDLFRYVNHGMPVVVENCSLSKSLDYSQTRMRES